MANRTARRRALATAMLAVSTVALLATSAPSYEPDVSDELSQHVDLSADQPVATTRIRLLVSGAALAAIGGGDESNIVLVATAGVGGEAGGVMPEFRLTSTSDELTAYNDGISADSARWRLDELCPGVLACDVAIDVSVEWLNAAPGATQPATVTVDAGIDYRAGMSDAGAPEGAELRLEVARELAQVAPGPMLRAATEPESVELSADAPFALRHVSIRIGRDAVPDGRDADEQAGIFAMGEVDDSVVVASVWPDPGQAGHHGGAPGSLLELNCERGVECERGFTLLLQWIGREPDERAEARWQFTSVLRYQGEAAAPAPEEISVSVDRVVGTGGAGRQRLEATASGSIEAAPDDVRVQAPVEPADGPHLFEVDLRTWQPVPDGSNVGIPTTGVMTLTARSADGSPLSGSVTVSVVTRHAVVQFGPPRRHELTPAAPRLEFAVLPSRSCHDPDLSEPPAGDGRCTVPFDVYVSPPSDAAGPVVVEWAIRLQAVEPDGLTLEPGDLRIGRER